MKSWSTSLWLTALGALLALAASGAHAQAQQDAAVQGPLLEEVLVTATRRELSLDQVAAAITVVDEEAIESLAPQVFAGALRGEPGVFFQQTTPGQGIPIVRGLKGSRYCIWLTAYASTTRSSAMRPINIWVWWIPLAWSASN